MRRLVLPALVIALGAILATPAFGSTTGCDTTGDRRSANDCITHTHVGASADRRVAPGHKITIRNRLHPALHGRALTTEVQFRRVLRGGERGPWVTIHRSLWPRTATAKRATRKVDVCRAVLAGRYQFRTTTRVQRSAMRPRSGRQAAPTAVIASAPTTVSMPNGPSTCPIGPQDENNIEYFNLMNFNEEYMIRIGAAGPNGVVTSGTPNAIALECPNLDMGLQPSLGVALFLVGEGTGVGCNSEQAPITFDRATLRSGGYASCPLVGGTPICNVQVVAYNTGTQAIYSETLLEVNMRVSSVSVPELEPASLPICNPSLPPCMLSGTCSLSTVSNHGITLCSTPAGCSASTTSPGYTDTIYFAPPR